MAAAGKLVFVTGFPQLDKKLREMPPALQRKFVRGGLRRGAKRVAALAKRIILNEAKDTGALEESIKVLALKRSTKRAGIAIMPNRDKLFAKYAARHEGRLPNPAKGETDPFYYAAAIEFGTEKQPAVKPFRRALYDSSSALREYFKADIAEFIATNKVTIGRDTSRQG